MIQGARGPYRGGIHRVSPSAWALYRAPGWSAVEVSFIDILDGGITSFLLKTCGISHQKWFWMVYFCRYSNRYGLISVGLAQEISRSRRPGEEKCTYSTNPISSWHETLLNTGVSVLDLFIRKTKLGDSKLGELARLSGFGREPPQPNIDIIGLVI